MQVFWWATGGKFGGEGLTGSGTGAGDDGMGRVLAEGLADLQGVSRSSRRR